MQITTNQLQLQETKVHGHSKVMLYFNIKDTDHRLSLTYQANGVRSTNITTSGDKNLFKSIDQTDHSIKNENLHARMRDKYSNVFSVLKPRLRLGEEYTDYRKEQLEKLEPTNIEEVSDYSTEQIANVPHEYARVMAILYGFCGDNRYKVTFSEEVTPKGKRKADREHDLKLFISSDDSLCVTAAKRRGHKVSTAPVTHIS